MAYAEKVRSPKGDYWRGRFRDPEGRWLTVRDDDGAVIRYAAKRDAEQAADDRESDVRAGRWRDPAAGQVTFAQWAAQWLDGLDLAASTMANLRQHLEYHLLPAFGILPLNAIDAAAITRWERTEKTRGYAPASLRTWRGVLHTCLEDAVGLHIAANPASRKRGRGRRSGRESGNRAPEKVITSPLGVLLIAERMAILSGRDDEFVMTVTCFWYGLRLGELTGLEKTYVRDKTVRVEWQLSEVEGQLLRVPPKDDSRGSEDTPAFLGELLAGHLARARPQPCPCHGHVYVFRGMAAPRRPAPGQVGPAWHWRRSSLEELFTAAASGWFPARSPLPRRPVPLAGGWPGTRVRGRNAQGRAEFCWLPVAEGLTPHGLRHSLKTWMEETRVPEVLSEERLRHEIPGISGVYRHVTPGMRAGLCAAMTGAWEATLDERLAMSAGSPVAVLDGLLNARLEGRRPALVPRNSPETPEGVLPFPVSTPSDLGRGGRI